VRRLTRRTPVTRFAAVAVLMLLFGLLAASSGFANGAHGKRVIVSPKHMHGWAFFEEVPEGEGRMVFGPENPPLGKGSAELEVDSMGREILGKAAYQGTLLSDFTKLTYWTFGQEGVIPPLAISLQFEIDPNLADANEAYQGRLVYEPYFTQVVLPDVWQKWNTQDDAPLGNWWFSRAPQNTPGIGCAQADPCAWSELLTKFPNAGVHRTFGAVLLKAGGPWPPGFVGNTDALAIGVRGKTTTYDFEPRPNS
jgi:hypothetical protein